MNASTEFRSKFSYLFKLMLGKRSAFTTHRENYVITQTSEPSSNLWLFNSQPVQKQSSNTVVISDIEISISWNGLNKKHKLDTMNSRTWANSLFNCGNQKQSANKCHYRRSEHWHSKVSWFGTYGSALDSSILSVGLIERVIRAYILKMSSNNWSWKKKSLRLYGIT